MSKITDTLGMRSLEEIMADTEEPEIEEEEAENNLPTVPEPSNSDSQLMTGKQMQGLDHSKRMDDLHAETLDVARKMVDLGMNIDPTKAPRLFEVANQIFKTALDSANSKRDSELKLMKLIQDQQKLDIDKKRLAFEIGEKGEISGEVIMVEDRNKLLAMLAQQKKSPEPEPEDS